MPGVARESERPGICQTNSAGPAIQKSKHRRILSGITHSNPFSLITSTASEQGELAKTVVTGLSLREPIVAPEYGSLFDAASCGELKLSRLALNFSVIVNGLAITNVKIKRRRVLT